MKRHIPYFSFYPADFMNGVRGLSAQDVGVYTMILCRIYEESGPVEYHPRRLATYCGMREPTFVKAVENLVDLGKLTLVDGHLSNNRAEAEISKRANDLENSSKAGKASAEKRHKKQQEEATTVQQSFNHTDTDTDTDTEEQQHCAREATEGAVDNSPSARKSGLDRKPGAIRESAGAALQPGAVRVAAQPDGSPPSPQAPDRRVRLLAAMGVGPDGVSGPSRFVGGVGDMAEADKWDAMGLTLDDQCRVISERLSRSLAKNPSFRAGSFSYFSGAMADLIAARSAQPSAGGGAPSDRAAKLRQYARIAGRPA